MTLDELRSGLLQLLSMGDFVAVLIPGEFDDRALEYGRALVDSRVLDLMYEDFFARGGRMMADDGSTVVLRSADGSERATLSPALIMFFIKFLLPILLKWINDRREPQASFGRYGEPTWPNERELPA